MHVQYDDLAAISVGNLYDGLKQYWDVHCTCCNECSLCIYSMMTLLDQRSC